MDDGRPIFLQIAELIENQVIDGSLVEGAQVPSTNEFAAFHRINPATALKGITLLVDAGVLYKRRGIGMFVAEGARARLLAERRERFAAEYVHPLVVEARALGLTTDHLIEMIRKGTP
ncbi:MAG: GntR family transcriptional regulator [Microbacteriaceae bacterium]|nr:GntR family transcriptional regulator [Microbacteriaceae bacterium]